MSHKNGRHRQAPVSNTLSQKQLKRLEAILWIALLSIPLLIGLAWGACFEDGAYVTFRYARNLANGRELAQGGPGLLTSPLYALALSLLARLRMPLPQAGLILSAPGWGVAAAAVYSVGRSSRRPVAAVLSAILIAFSPVMPSTLGTEIPWTVALAWIAIASSMKKQWRTQTVALALMLCTHLDSSTLALATLSLVIQWRERKRFPLQSSLVLAPVLLGWGLLAEWQIVALGPVPHLGLAEWERIVRQLLDESEFYWLFLAFIGLGLVVMRRALWAELLWGAILILSGGAVAWATAPTLGCLLAGLGIDWGIEWVETHDITHLDRFTLTLSLALVAGLPPGIAQASSLYQRYQFRPVTRQALEEQAGDWLRAHSEATATVFGSQRVGYLADRSTHPWDGVESDQAELTLLLGTLHENPPEYCVSFKSLAWDRLTRTGWFQDSYTPLQKFESPYDNTSPFTIWGYRLRAFTLGEHRPLPLNAHLPGKVDLVGYTYWPNRIQAGDAVSVTLFLQATQPITETFPLVVRMTSLGNGASWAQRTIITPRSVLIEAQQTKQVLAKQVVLTATTGIPIGAYHLDVSVLTPDLESVLPIYQRNDTAFLDRITLGYIVVPWQGKAQQAALDTAKLVDANFGNKISLLSFEVADSLSPGTEFDVTLYWEAQRSPEDDYVVFIHLLDANGQLVANHDGAPMNGQYVTRAWLPGEIVPDVHHMALNPQIPVGTYRLQVGMYQWPSLERLQVWDKQGIEQAERVIVLQSIQVQ